MKLLKNALYYVFARNDSNGHFIEVSLEKLYYNHDCYLNSLSRREQRLNQNSEISCSEKNEADKIKISADSQVKYKNRKVSLEAFYG